MPDIKERPILFSGAMVCAILDGSKTQTRRVMKPQPVLNQAKQDGAPAMWEWGDCQWTDGGIGFPDSAIPDWSPFGVPGNRLWVRETWTVAMHGGYAYRADKDGEIDAGIYAWKPSIHMPRSACRILLEITKVRVERLQDISEEDAKAEGVDERFEMSASDFIGKKPINPCYRIGFKHLWDSINAKRGFGWDANPWVWVIEFRRVENA